MQYARESAVICKAEPWSVQPWRLNEVCRRLRLKHYSLLTEQVCLHWIRQFIRANGLRLTRKIEGDEAEAISTEMAMARARSIVARAMITPLDTAQAMR